MKQKDIWKSSIEQSAILNPVDRISEVLFGLIMLLTFTGAISVSSDGSQEIRDLLWAALGCNLAWGLVDAIMYLMNILFERGFDLNIIRKIRSTTDLLTRRKLLREEIQPLLAEMLTDEEIDKLGERIKRLPEPSVKIPLTFKDFLSAIQIFLLVFLCTLPVALPFGLFNEPAFALRISNGVALLLLFVGGYILAHNAGFKKILSALIYLLIGLFLVSITIALGG